jgi:glycosyltransferase involved in cell wall biosynthesis
MPRVLFVSYTFPPVGGAGVQRLTKWLKYLPASCWDTSVLTVGNPSVPVTDSSLGFDVPATTRVVRARTLEPSYSLKMAMAGAAEGPRRAISRWQSTLRAAAGVVLQPDPQVLWVPGAVRAGRRLLSEVAHHAIVATGPPFSSFLVAARLARKARLPLVLDFRDEWDLSSRYWENRPRDPLSRAVQSRMQAILLRRAQLVLATTRRSVAALAEQCRLVGSTARTTCIYNGYDADDFATSAAPPSTPGRFRLAYVGTLWALTDARPLVTGLRHLSERWPQLAGGLEVVVAGRRTEAQSALLAGARGQPFRVTLLDYVEHTAAVELMKNSDALCLLLSDVPGADRVVPAKLFEYMAARRPILAIAPRGEVRELLEDHPATYACDPGNAASIAASIAGAVEAHRVGQQTNWRGWDPERFSRARLTAQLAEALQAIATSGAVRHGASGR